MDQGSAALQLAGELQSLGNIVSALRGTTLVIDVSQPNAYEDLLLTFRQSDDFKEVRLDGGEGGFLYAGVRFVILRDGIVAYIEALKE